MNRVKTEDSFPNIDGQDLLVVPIRLACAATFVVMKPSD